mmetsp:Transcript_6598/g.15775  ORF Transcript_6598/g.15775 Transcript_6598/m.15775 type:complete len:267 (-) Transcript_6598:331-1131(-)
MCGSQVHHPHIVAAWKASLANTVAPCKSPFWSGQLCRRQQCTATTRQPPIRSRHSPGMAWTGLAAIAEQHHSLRHTPCCRRLHGAGHPCRKKRSNDPNLPHCISRCLDQPSPNPQQSLTSLLGRWWDGRRIAVASHTRDCTLAWGILLVVCKSTRKPDQGTQSCTQSRGCKPNCTADPHTVCCTWACACNPKWFGCGTDPEASDSTSGTRARRTSPDTACSPQPSLLGSASHNEGDGRLAGNPARRSAAYNSRYNGGHNSFANDWE